MQIEHFILANNSSIDVNTNSLSVFGVLDDLQIQAPAGTPLNLNFHAILIVKRNEEAGAVQSEFIMTVIAPNGSRIGQEMKMPVAMQPNHRRSRLRVIAEIPLHHSGTYTVKMTNAQDESVTAEVGLNVKILPVAVQ